MTQLIRKFKCKRVVLVLSNFFSFEVIQAILKGFVDIIPYVRNIN